MERTQMDIIDLLINTLQEHEKFMDKLSFRLENTMKIVDQLSAYTICQGKLNKLEEFAEMRKVGYLEGKELGVFVSSDKIIGDYNEILQIIRGEG